MKGYEQQYGIDFRETFALVVYSRTVRVLLALAAILDLEIHQMDVKKAFPDGELKEEVYMEIPEGFEERYNVSKPERHGVPERRRVLQLHKSLYRLKQVPRVEQSLLTRSVTKYNSMLGHGDDGKDVYEAPCSHYS